MNRLSPSAAVAVIVVVLALLVAGCGPTAQAIQTPTPGPTLKPDQGDLETMPPDEGLGTIPPPPSFSIAPDAVWQLASGFPTNGAFEVDSVAATANGFTAVGFAAAPGQDYFGQRVGVVWTSTDGVTWQQSSDTGLTNVTPQTLVASGSDLYLLGNFSACSQLGEDSCTEPPDAGNSVWRSTNGGDWTRLPQFPDLANGLPDGLAVLHDKVIVTGQATDDAGTSSAWVFSASTWSTTTDLGGLESPIYAMAATPTGFVGFGTHYDDATETSSVTAATSGDGIHFTPITLPALTGIPNPEVDAVTSNGSVLVAVGFGEDDNGGDFGFSMYSSDGTNWTVATDSDGKFKGGVPSTVAPVSGGYLSIGYRYDTQDQSRLIGTAWFSADGHSWRGLSDTGGSFSDINSFAATANTAVIFAVEQSDTSTGGLVSNVVPWYGHIDKLTTP